MSVEIPAFPRTRKLSLEDKITFNSYFKNTPQSISEMTFTNFFIWRDCDLSEMTNINGNICVIARPNNEVPYFFEPMGGNKIDETISACLSFIPRLSRVSEGFMNKYLEGRKGLKIEADRDNSDYLYRASDLIDLKGKKYDGKRNRIKKFLKNNLPEYRTLSQGLVTQCMELLDRWENGKKPGVCFDLPIKEALNSLGELDVKGAAIIINGRVEAFSVGEKLNKDTAVVYIEVANQAIDGLSQYINQQFCRNEWSDMAYVNRESDLGNTGLRKAKTSYHPFKMINKYNITI